MVGITIQACRRIQAWLQHCWSRLGTQLEVTMSLRGLWHYLAALYLISCLGQSVLECVLTWPNQVKHVWFLGLVLEPLFIGVLIGSALKVPRHCFAADVAFLGSIFVDMIFAVGFMRIGKPARDVDLQFIWFYSIVSLSVFAGFHRFAIMLFWVASSCLLLVRGCTGADLKTSDFVAWVFGAAISAFASFIQCRISDLYATWEKHRNAERALLDYATEGTCVVDLLTGKVLEMSMRLQQVLGPTAHVGRPVQDFVIQDDQHRAEALLCEAGAGSLGATVVTLQLTSDKSAGHRLQDARVIAYSAAQSTIKICLQLLGESRIPEAVDLTPVRTPTAEAHHLTLHPGPAEPFELGSMSSSGQRRWFRSDAILGSGVRSALLGSAGEPPLSVDRPGVRLPGVPGSVLDGIAHAASLEDAITPTASAASQGTAVYSAGGNPAVMLSIAAARLAAVGHMRSPASSHDQAENAEEDHELPEGRARSASSVTARNVAGGFPSIAASTHLLGWRSDSSATLPRVDQ